MPRSDAILSAGPGEGNGHDRSAFVPAAEAQFLAGLARVHMGRVLQEDLVPAFLLERQGADVRFARLAAAFASFYFDGANPLLAPVRRDILHELGDRVRGLDQCWSVASLQALPSQTDWKAERRGVEVDVTRYVVQAYIRAEILAAAHTLVSAVPAVLDGQPCFAGTRVPIRIVLQAAQRTQSAEELRQAYPFLTAAHLTAARIYLQAHPQHQGDLKPALEELAPSRQAASWTAPLRVLAEKRLLRRRSDPRG